MGSYSAQRKSNIVSQKTKNLLARNLVEQNLKTSLDTPKIFTKKTFQWYSKALYESDWIDYPKFFPQIMSNSVNKLKNLNQLADANSQTKIPLITHQMYFFFDSNTNQIAQSTIDATSRTIERFNKADSSYKHFVWTNNIAMIPQGIKDLANVEVRSMTELQDKRLFKEFNILHTQGQVGLDKGKISMASDTFRTLVVREFGGLYRDFDSEILDAEAIIKVKKAVSFLGGLEFSLEDLPYSGFGSAIFAATPNHRVQIIESYMIERNIYKDKQDLPVPEYIKYPFSKFDQALYYSGGPFTITAAIYKALPEMRDDYIIAPPKVLFNYEYGWLITPSSPCRGKLDKIGFTPKLINEYDGHIFETYSYDPFCGSWAESSGYKDPIKYFDDNNSLEIVIARYNENLDWIRDTFAYSKVTVYNKGPNNLENLPYNVQVINLPNVGRESHTYLYHVIMNYDNIAGRTVFLQGDPFFHAPNLKRFIEGSPSSCSNTIVELMNGDGCHIKNLGDLSHELSSIDWKNSKWSDTRLSDETLLEFARHNINPSFNANSPISHIPGGQFAVDKENILCHSVDFHKKLYDYFDHDRSPIEGHYMERLWNEWANCDNQG
ncbi:MAG: DUF3431 domain-containing protein [Rickettsiales bacterium]